MKLRGVCRWLRESWLLASIGLGLVAALSGGCQRGRDTSAGVASVPVEQAAPAVEQAFAEAAPEVKEQATEAAAALQSQDDAGAFLRLEQLVARPELTDQQRRAAYDAWMAANQRLQAAATNGDTAAEAVLEQYRARK
jgi:hypothetical protein